MPKVYKRHDKSDIFIHWFNAACWFLLLLTGVGLIQNPAIDPLIRLSGAMRAMVGVAATCSLSMSISASHGYSASSSTC